MRSITAEDRVIYVTFDINNKKISEAKFKLAGLNYGHGRIAREYYWSFPSKTSQIGYSILKQIFSEVKPIH